MAPEHSAASYSTLDLEPGDATRLSDLRVWARTEVGPSEELELLLTELVVNARRHGARAPIHIEIFKDAASTGVKVTNRSRSGAPVTIQTGPPVSATSESGRGLQIAKTLSDQLSIEQTGQTVTVSALILLPSMFFSYRFDSRAVPLLRIFGVRSDLDGIRIEDGNMSASFGFLDVDTPTANITSAQVTGPYRWFKALGPRLSAADRGLTFGTTAARGVCLRFETPIPSVIGPWPHPGLTLTVDDPEQFVAAIDKARQ